MNDNTRRNAYCTTQTKTFTSSRRRNTNTDQENTNKRTKSNKTVEKKDGQTWKEDEIVYIDGKIYVLKTDNFKMKYSVTTIIYQMSDIQDNTE